MVDPRASATRLPHGPGVYRFRDERERVLYVGRASDLRNRVSSYWGPLTGRRHLRRMVPQIARVEALECASPHEAAWLERNLLERTLHRWNRARGGAELVTWIEVDESPRHAGVRLLHHPGTRAPDSVLYGPYLGADKAQLVVRALGRLAPLDATRTGLSGAAAALAEARGVGPAQREDIAVRIRAILIRDAAAVESATQDLLAAREAAAERLAFETAAHLTAEAQALAWASGLQRVTLPGGPDTEAHAWADGVLVSLRVTGGRLDGWRARTIEGASARRWEARSDPALAAFAQQAAELAATLRA